MNNILETLDKLIIGLVEYAYNILYTCWWLLLRPVRSPLRLARRYRAPKLTQVSGITTLMLVYALAFTIIVPIMTDISALFGGDTVPSLSAADFAPDRSGAFQFKVTIPFIVGGLFSAVMVDALGRLVALIGGLSERRAALLRSSWQYAAAAGPLALSTMLLLFAMGEAPFGLLSNFLNSGSLSGLLDIAVLALYLRGCAAIGLRWSRLMWPAKGKRKDRTAITTIITLAFALYAFIAGMVGLTVAATVGLGMNEQHMPEVVAKTCRIDGNVATATLVFTTDSARPQRIAFPQWRVAFLYPAQDAAKGDAYGHHFTPGPGQAWVAEPSRAVTLTDRSTVPEAIRARVTGCEIRE